MNCVNCTEPAKYVFQAPGVADQPYCDRHLPAAYQNTEWVFPAPVEALTPLPTAEPLAEVAPVEAPVDEPSEEKPEEDPNPELKAEPRRRSSRKTPGER